MHNLCIEDSAALAALHAQCFDVAWDEAAFAGLFKTGAFGYALSASSLHSFILLRSAATETEVLTLATHPAYQRQGLANQLLEHLCTVLAQKDMEEIFLEVRADNAAAQALYQNSGFMLLARRPDYYTLKDGSFRDATVWKKILLKHAPL